jgi:hypothetical protein
MSDDKTLNSSDPVIIRIGTTIKNPTVEKCPICGVLANLTANPIVQERTAVSIYKCPNGHEFNKFLGKN